MRNRIAELKAQIGKENTRDRAGSQPEREGSFVSTHTSFQHTCMYMYDGIVELFAVHLLCTPSDSCMSIHKINFVEKRRNICMG